ncbi:MAG: hypothetical protein J5606_04255 [Bacteroidales bacterium]|nr:hypothetical protein [Bacteroidales bacterium]
MATITLRTKTKVQYEAVMALLKALKISCEVSENEEYDPEMLKKIEKGRKDFVNGNYKIINVSDIWK